MDEVLLNAVREGKVHTVRELLSEGTSPTDDELNVLDLVNRIGKVSYLKAIYLLLRAQ